MGTSMMDTTGSDQAKKTTSQPSNRFRDAFAVGAGLFIVAFFLISQTSQELSTLTETNKHTNEELLTTQTQLLQTQTALQETQADLQETQADLSVLCSFTLCGAHGTCDSNLQHCVCYDGFVGGQCEITPLYAVGGEIENDHELNTAERYDTDTNSWTPIASMGTARSGLGLTTYNNTLYAVGGENHYGASDSGELNTAERYDPDTNSWTPIASMGTARSGVALTALNNKLYAVGGHHAYNTAERYDPDTNSWTPIASMTTTRSGLALTALNNKLYAVGGLGLNTAERYDPDTNSWTHIASMGTARDTHGLIALNNKLYAVGGYGLNTAERYDPDTHSWTPIASMGIDRSGLGLTALNNKLYAVGGYSTNYSGVLNTAERYDPDTNSWTPIASMDTARKYLGLTAL